MSDFGKILMKGNPSSLWPSQRTSHTHVIGQPGTGKSRAIESWVMQDILARRGVGLIDPHGDLFLNIFHRLANKPELWDRVVIIDPLQDKWTAVFNPLQVIQEMPPERISQFLTDVALKIWGIDPNSAPRMVWLLTNTFLALSSLGLSLLHLKKFLLDQDYRDSLLAKLGNQQVLDYFHYEFPSKQAGVHQWTTPLLNKLGGLIFDPDMRLMLTTPSTINFRHILDRGLILLVNLPKGLLGESASSLLAAFILAHIQKAALARADSEERKPFYLYLDEFQNYTTGNIKDILSESRKYALSLILAHQYLGQLPSEIKQALLNTAGNLASFRVGRPDAAMIARHIFPRPGFLNEGEHNLRMRRVGFLPRLSLEGRMHSGGWEALAAELSQLRHREFWFRSKGFLRPTKQLTFTMPDPVLTPELESKLRKFMDVVGNNYGRLKAEVRVQMAKEGLSSAANSGKIDPFGGIYGEETKSSFWES